MIPKKSSRIFIVCGVFLVLLLITSSFDLALTSAIILLLINSTIDYRYVFISSIVLFVLDWLLGKTELRILFLNELSADAYILFITGVVLYLKTRKDVLHLLERITQREKKILSQTIILKLALCTIFGILLLPILGMYISSLVSYAIFSYLIRQFNGKIAVSLAILILPVTAISLLLNNHKLAEEMGNYVFFFLAVGTIQEVINLARTTKGTQPVSDYRQSESFNRGFRRLIINNSN